MLGDQLNRGIASLVDAEPAATRVLMVTSAARLARGRWHRQRLHAVLAGMRRFAQALEAEGFAVDLRDAPSLADGYRDHCREHSPASVVAMEPMSIGAHALLTSLGVTLVRSSQFLCHPSEFAAWAVSQGSKRLTMENFYRWQRQRLGILMDGSRPAGGQWNFDHDNRQPPPSDGRSWPAPVLDELDDLDRSVISSLPDSAFGADPTGWWPTTREGALRRLEAFIRDGLPRFGPHEDAMLTDEPKLAHSVLSSSMNLGLLHPGEVVAAAEAAYRAGDVPIASAEGFIRQIIGWREYVWGLYWLWMPSYRHQNALDAHRPLPPLFTGGSTQMHCVSVAISSLEERAWLHHIQRLMVLGNLLLLSGVEPLEAVDWMWKSFIDGAEWVMIPNLIGMSLHADGGRMATKPYAGGGAYINRMSDHCRGCRYDPRKRTGDDACPFTTLYWDFLARHRDRFAGNHRMVQQVRGLDRLSDLPAVRSRAAEVLGMLDAGTL